MIMPLFDLVIGVVPDYMHGSLLGATKLLLQLWFSSTNSKKSHFIGNSIEKISRRMDSLKPPSCVDRLPKNLEANYQKFKATEYQVFLLFYGIPCLYGILPEKYLNHFAMLSEAIYILVSDTISESDILRSRYLCEEFYRQFAELYGEENCGLNIHNIGDHLVDYVVPWGSLTEWSNFGYEDVNGCLKKSVKGSGDITIELMQVKHLTSKLKKMNVDEIIDDDRKVFI